MTTKKAPVSTPKKPAATVDSSEAAPTPPPTDVATEDAAIHEPLEKFAGAAAHGEVAIRDAFPEIPAPVLDKLKTFLANVEYVTAKPVYGPPTIAGDKAELKYTLNFSFMYRDSKAPGTAPFRYKATLTRHKDGWALSDLTPLP